MSSDRRFDLEIAIIGMAGRFPGAETIEAFWENLRAGVESIRDLSTEELRAAGQDDASLSDSRLVKRAADLKDADRFDAALFGFTPREAELMDPQFRVFLEDAWAALENAGYLGCVDLNVGVFAGASPNTYLLNNVYANPGSAESVGAFQTSIGNVRDYLATHVSYRLDLRGPSLVVQTACSTSLVAVHLACQSLLGRECEIALAGGVSISVPQTSGYPYEEGGIASPDGRCRAFDDLANGCVRGNGSGIVVLRRLEDALRDGDAIRAVIKGSAVNNDGGVKIGFTAPSVEGQTGVIAEALAAAGVDPATITYVEAHGTGTALGDPVEVAALARAFGLGAGMAGRCAIGSVKTNVGHLDAAAGMAGLIKTVLALEHREIPPTLHFRRPNARIDFASTPFFVNDRLRAWPADGGPRRAGVSSFGIGGTNAHLILEEAPDAERSETSRPAQLLLLSAATEPALADASRALADRLDSDTGLPFADAAFTLQVGRKRLPWRRAIVSPDAASAGVALRGGTRFRAARHEERRQAEVAFLFPGQGSQHAGMAEAIYRSEPVFRDAFDRCAAILRPLLGLDLREVVFASSRQRAAADERLRETALAQPALFSVEYALACLWMSWGIRPTALAGHSVGEYVAACLSSVMTLEDSLGLVAERGRLMSGMPRGAMLAVQLGEEALSTRLNNFPDLSLAAVNAASSCVASGPDPEIDRLAADLGAAGVACRRLNTSHAFHSAMMEPVLPVFEDRLRHVRLDSPSIPFLSNVSGTWIVPQQATDPIYWARHLRQTVRFADNIAALVADPSRVLLEVGPGAALSSLARMQAGHDVAIIASLRHQRDHEGAETATLEALGQLWCAGVDVDWSSFHDGFGRRRVALPTYPFQRQRYWVDAASGIASRESAGASGASTKDPDMADWFYVPGWRRSHAPPAATEPGRAWLIFDDGSQLARAVADLAVSRGGRVATVRAGREYAREAADRFSIDPRAREHYGRLLRDLGASEALPGRLVHLWCADGSRTDPDAAQDLGFFSLLYLMQALGNVGKEPDLRLAAVATGLFDVAGESVLCPERATLVGACRVVPQEYPNVTCRLLDVVGEDATEAAIRIVAEIESSDRERVVAWRGGHRWVPFYERVRLEPPVREPVALPAGGAYLLTGGTGPFELAIASRLAAQGARGIAFLACAPGAESAVEELCAAGVEVLCFRAGATEPDTLREAVAEAREKLGRFTAIFHTAGEIGGGMIQIKEPAAARRVLAPRLEGARILAGALAQGERLLLSSSAVSATGVFGQVDFTAASAFLDAFAHARRIAGQRVTAIDWGTAHWDRWQDASGAGSQALAHQLREIQRSVGITIDEGVEALWRVIDLSVPQVVVSPQNLDELVSQSTTASVAEFLAGVAPDTPATRHDEREVVPLASDTERRVASVWTSLLGLAPIGRTDNFFDLGGNSLLAIQLASQLRRTFDVDLTIASLFESADLAGLAASVDAALEDRRQTEEVARLLEEIERLSEEEIRTQLEREAGAGAGGVPR